MWGLVLLIFGLIFLIVYYENKDKKHYTNVVCNSDINIVDDNINLNKNGVTLENSSLDYLAHYSNVSYIQRSYFVQNEPSPNNYNYYNVTMNYYCITFRINELIDALTLYYGSNIPDMLYFNFNSALYCLRNSSYWSSTYDFDALYGFYNSDLDLFLQYGSVLSVSIPLYSAYMLNNDYTGFTFSIPFDYTYYKNYPSQSFYIAIPQQDRCEYGSSSSSFSYNYFTFDYNDNEYAFFIDDKSFSNDNYGVMYNNLSNQYAELQNQYNELNASYEQVNSNYEIVSNNYNNLSSQYSSLNSDYNSLNTTYQQLDSNYQSLLEQYNSLNNENYTFSELFWSLSAVPFGVLSSGFNVNVLGVNLAAIISGLFTAVLLIWIIKKFLR